MYCIKCGGSRWTKKGWMCGKQRLKCKICGYKTINTSPNRNILIVGDIHEPFCLDGYLEFNKMLYKKWNCNTVIFIGDIIDNHYASYHETDPDGLGGGDELNLAIERLQRWYDTFPYAKIVLGNHDLMIHRKVFSSGISKHWIKEFPEALGCPTWEFLPDLVLDDVWYRHGVGTKAAPKSGKEMSCVVQGHFHTEAYVIWKVGRNFKTFGMQVGSGICIESYAMAYARPFPKPVISSGVVLNNGKLPIIELMEL